MGLIGADTFHDLERKYSQRRIVRFLAPFRSDFPQATRQYVRQLFTQNADSALVEKIAADMSEAPPEVALGALEELLRYDSTETLREVRAPIHWFNSDKYPVNMAAGQRLASSFEIKRMSGVGHFCYDGGQ